MWSHSILIIPQVHPDCNLGFCSSSWQKSKSKGPAFWCKLSTEFEKSFLLPSNHRALTGVRWYWHLRVTDERWQSLFSRNLWSWRSQNQTNHRSTLSWMLLQWRQENSALRVVRRKTMPLQKQAARMWHREDRRQPTRTVSSHQREQHFDNWQELCIKNDHTESAACSGNDEWLYSVR